jgi:uncharacterized protein involved in exopolysaccharide biosynthesis
LGRGPLNVLSIMLQINRSEIEQPIPVDEQSLDLSYYAVLLKKRILFLILPFVLVLAGGSALAMLWPATYLSEGKILVESQQIPTDLVRPSVTTGAKERIQVIQQRVLTRENLLAIADKYQMYPSRRDRLSRTELLDVLRENILIEPIDLDQASGRNQTIALKVGFTDQRPDVATKVANDLLTLFLNEDARNRTNRATETSRFLAREAQRLEGELTAIEVKIVEAKRQLRNSPTLDSAGGYQVSPVTALKTELAQKRAIYSKTHPLVKRLEAQLAAVEQLDLPSPASTAQGRTGSTADDGLDALIAQRTSIQKNVENANQKLTAARLGESLERDQFSERLEVLEQAVTPQKPVKPNRPKIIALAFVAAVIAGLGAVFVIEMFDKTIRGSQDLLRLGGGGHMVVIIPYLSTKAELKQTKQRMGTAAAIFILCLVAGLAAVNYLVRPLDELWPLIVARIM